MNIDIHQGSIQDFQADTLIVNLFEGQKNVSGATAAVDKELEGAISEVISSGDFKGKNGDVCVLYSHGRIPARRVIVVGLGRKTDFTLETVRLASAYAIERAEKLNAQHVATIVHGGGSSELPLESAAQATVEGSLLSLYRFSLSKKNENYRVSVDRISIVEFEQWKIGAIEKGAWLGKEIARGVNLARDLVNLPPNRATPTRLAEFAREIAEKHMMKIMVGDREWAENHNMGAYLAVAQGAGEQPQFIVVEHNGDRDDLKTIVLVGKGITFDTGGISIKPAEKMSEMKSDMGGAAVVLAVMDVVGNIKLPVRVIGIAPCTENMPDANAYRPADVITASNDVTIEVINTDAEGRMILADALAYATRYHPDAVIDLATLTGSCVIALGENIAAGIFSNNEELQTKLIASGSQTHERLWPLPLWDDYLEAIKSEVADIKNSGGRYGGVGTSAMFLNQFVDYPWAHIDIAGMVLRNKRTGYHPIGATGFGVRLLVDYLLHIDHV